MPKLRDKRYWSADYGDSYNGAETVPVRADDGVLKSVLPGSEEDAAAIEFTIEFAGKEFTGYWREQSRDCAAEVRMVLAKSLGREMKDVGDAEINC